MFTNQKKNKKNKKKVKKLATFATQLWTFEPKRRRVGDGRLIH